MYSTQGIILKREDFRERDERIVLYTKDFGKISIVAKGVKRIEAKLRGNLDIFNFVDIIFAEGRHFFILTGIDTRERLGKLVVDPYVYSTVLSCVRSVADIFEENLRDKDFFDFLHKTLKKLDQCAQGRNPSLHAWLILKKFQMTILENQGYGKGLEDQAKALSTNAALVLGMLHGSPRKTARLAPADFWGIEEMFEKTFAYFFNYSPSSWIPEIS